MLSIKQRFTASVVFLALVLNVQVSHSATVTADEAQTAVGNWLDCRAQLECRLGTSVADVRTCMTTNGAAFHVVRLESGGFVVTSADTELEPVVAFSPSGDLVESDQNPLWAMLNRDFSEQTKVPRLLHASSAASTGNTGSTAARKWARLLPVKATNGAARLLMSTGQETVSDVRVSPLLATRWNQKQDSYYSNMGDPCYNYYTPSNYYCGCVATATAQIMRYHRYPTESVIPGTYACRVDYRSESLTMQGGIYDWDNMPEIPADGTSLAQRQAIGKLTSDIGIAALMSYASDGSSAGGYMPAKFLPERFRYANAIAFAGGLNMSMVKSAILPNLDARLPVVMGLSGNGGHAVVADGYGYSLGTLYLHVNLGWGGMNDAWYAPPNVERFTSVDSVVCNIYPTGDSGRVICSGRVLSSDTGNPISGYEVAAAGTGSSVKTTTDSKGIYAFILKAGVYVISCEGARLAVTLEDNVPSEITEDGQYYLGEISVGNRHGCDLSIASSETPATSFIVRFDLGDHGTRTGGGAFDQVVDAGAAAVAPEFTVASGWRFVGWDKPFDAVSSDITVTARYEVVSAGVHAGVWTTDVDAVRVADDCRLVVVLCANYGGCWWSQQVQPIFESATFLSWAAENGVYLVTSDDSRLPAGCTDATDAYSWFVTLYWSVPHPDDYVYYPTIAVARATDLDQAVCFDEVRNDGTCTVGGVLYTGTAQSLIAGLSTYLSDPKTEVKIGKPTAVAELVYTGAKQRGVNSDERLTVSGTTEATDAKTGYSATFALPAETSTSVYRWSDGTTADVTVVWNIAPRAVTDPAVSFAAIPDQTHTGAALMPSVTMTFAGKARTLGTDYTVAYADNVNVGTATVTVKGNGNFTGTKVLSFKIVAPPPIYRTVSFDANGGTVGTASREVESGKTLGELPTPTRLGYDFLGWYTAKNGGESVTPDRTIAVDAAFYARWEAIDYAIAYVLDGGKNPPENPVTYTVEDALALAVPTRDGYTFAGWTPDGGMIAKGSTGDRTFTANWEAAEDDSRTVGKYISIDLVKDLGVDLDEIDGVVTDYRAGDKVAIKIEGLAKGLKLAQDKTSAAWILSGVPTETALYATQPMFARVTVTYKDKTKGANGKAEKLYLLPLDVVAADARTLVPAGILNGLYEPIDIAKLWPEVADAKANPKDWTFKTWPAGLAFKDGVLSGKPTKAGEFTITATHKRKPADGKTTVSETYSAVMTVWGDDGATTFRYTDQAYVATATKNLDRTVTGVSGQPTGIKFDKKTWTLSGTPTKAGVYVTTFTKSDKSKETFLWKVTEGENDGFLGTMDWTVADSAVTVMQGVVQNGWTCSLPADAKVTAKLPAGLVLAQDKLTKKWMLSGTPTTVGNNVVTFTTVRNGVTVTERLLIVVTPNEWTGNWYGVQKESYEDSSLNVLVNVAANGTVKLTLAEGDAQVMVKTSVTAKNLNNDGRTATLNVLRGKDILRTFTVDFASGTLKSGDTVIATLYEMVVPETADKSVSTFVLEEINDGDTNAYAYVTATYDAKKNAFTLAGKLWDGTVVKGTAYPLAKDTADGGHYISPVLITDKAKNAVYIELSDDGSCARVIENGEKLEIGTPWTRRLAASEIKGSTFRTFAGEEACICIGIWEENSSYDAAGRRVYEIDLADKDRGAKLAANGLVKLTLTDADGWKWVCELLPVDNDGKSQFRGIATGTGKDPVAKKPLTLNCSVWSK